MPVRRVRAMVVAAVVFVAVFAGVAQAANLTMGPSQMGAGSVVADCQSTAVTPDWQFTYDPAIPGHRISAVTLDGLAPACLGRNVSVVLAGAGGSSVAVGSAVTPPSGTSVTVPLGTGYALTGAGIRQLSVVIYS